MILSRHESQRLGQVFWENVIVKLREKGITRKEFSNFTGISPSQITKGIREKHLPRLDLSLKIADLLESNVEKLFGVPDYLLRKKIDFSEIKEKEIEAVYQGAEEIK